MKNDPVLAKQVLLELQKRKRVPFVIEDFCFDKQLQFIQDKSRYKTAVCSRRSGKSTACAADLIRQSVTVKNSTSLYVTLTRGNAKKIVWREILAILKQFNVPHEVNNTDLSIKFADTNSIIYFAGSNKKDEIEKFRGLKLHLVYLDEVQSFRPFIKELIDDVLAYCVLDTSGTLCLIGTPGPIPGGYFYEASHSMGWSNHKWTIFDNPFIALQNNGKTPEQLLTEERQRRGITETDPAYLREALGLWVQDFDCLVYKYKAEISHYTELPPESDLVYVFGVDLGFNDADAIAILAYSKTTKQVYLVEELIKEKQGITELAEQIKIFVEKYKPIKIKIDAGALGKKIAEELRRRHQIPVEAAEKNRKFEFIELLNDDLRTGKLRIKKDSTCAQDYLLIQWDVLQKEKRSVSDNFHSDVADAVLYAWRECKHYLSQKIEVPKFSDEEKVEKFWEQQSKEIKKVNNNDWWEK